jgi:hypothetical protein
VFLSHTSEFRDFPSGRSYMEAVESAVSAAGHVIVDMREFAASDAAPAQVCQEKVRGCEVYLGIFGTHYGSPVRDRPEVSYTELEFETASDPAHPLERLVFLLDQEAENPGIPPKWLNRSNSRRAPTGLYAQGNGWRSHPADLRQSRRARPASGAQPGGMAAA